QRRVDVDRARTGGLQQPEVVRCSLDVDALPAEKLLEHLAAALLHAVIGTGLDAHAAADIREVGVVEDLVDGRIELAVEAHTPLVDRPVSDLTSLTGRATSAAPRSACPRSPRPP